MDEEIHFHSQYQTFGNEIVKQIGPTLTKVISKLCEADIHWCITRRDNCQEVRVESSQSREWTALLEAPL